MVRVGGEKRPSLGAALGRYAFVRHHTCMRLVQCRPHPSHLPMRPSLLAGPAWNRLFSTAARQRLSPTSLGPPRCGLPHAAIPPSASAGLLGFHAHASSTRSGRGQSATAQHHPLSMFLRTQRTKKATVSCPGPGSRAVVILAEYGEALTFGQVTDKAAAMCSGASCVFDVTQFPGFDAPPSGKVQCWNMGFARAQSLPLTSCPTWVRTCLWVRGRLTAAPPPLRGPQQVLRVEWTCSCGDGLQSTKDAAGKCRKCNPGSRRGPGDPDCSQCLPGTYQDEEGQARRRLVWGLGQSSSHRKAVRAGRLAHRARS